MVKIWSELPGARRQEQLADIATIVWVIFWGRLVWLLYELARRASPGPADRSTTGGAGLIQAGLDLGRISPRPAGRRRSGCGIWPGMRWSALGSRFADFGSEVAAFVLIVAAALALLLA